MATGRVLATSSSTHSFVKRLLTMPSAGGVSGSSSPSASSVDSVSSSSWGCASTMGSTIGCVAVSSSFLPQPNNKRDEDKATRKSTCNLFINISSLSLLNGSLYTKCHTTVIITQIKSAVTRKMCKNLYKNIKKVLQTIHGLVQKRK